MNSLSSFKKLAVCIILFSSFLRAENVRIGFISKNIKFADTVDGFLQKNYASLGKNLSFVDFGVYDRNNQLDLKAVENKIESLSKTVNFLYLDFNQPMKDDLQALAVKIQDVVRSQTLIIANGGLSQDPSSTSQIKGTLFGKINGLVLIGEMDQRERLIPGSYFGPELLTAVKPPRQWEWPGAAGLLFVSSLGTQWFKRSVIDWKLHFAQSKSSSKKLWLRLEELF
jgi:hypothetical protein